MLSLILDDGSEQPIALISRSLSPAGKWYTQLALAIVFSVTNFHVYLYDSEHNPLPYLFNPSRVMAFVRIQCWELHFSSY